MARRTAIWPRRTRSIVPTIGRLFLQRARRQAFWPVSSSGSDIGECTCRDFQLWAITRGGRGAKGCRTCEIYFQVGRLRTNSKVRATLGALTRRARFVGRLRRACAGGRLRRGSQGGKRRGWGDGGAAHPLQSGRKVSCASGLGRLGIIVDGPLG